MSLPTREELLQRFGDVTDPEILARRKHILDVLLETCPEVKQPYIEKGQLIGVRDVLRRLLARRQLPPNEDEDARIDACTDLATLERWIDRAVTAASVSDALA